MATVVSDLDLNNADNSISTLAPDNVAETTPVRFEHQNKAGPADYTKGLSLWRRKTPPLSSSPMDNCQDAQLLC